MCLCVCDIFLCTYREMGRKERETLQKMAEITKEGFLLKQQLIDEAKKGQQEKQVSGMRGLWEKGLRHRDINVMRNG